MGPGSRETPSGSRFPPFEGSPTAAHATSEEPRCALGLGRVAPETIEGPELAARPLQGLFCHNPGLSTTRRAVPEMPPQPVPKESGEP